MEKPEETKSFYETAKRFCDWAESDSSDESATIHSTLKLLSALYHQALLLPEPAPENPVEKNESIAKLDSKKIYQKFSKLPFQFYFDTFNPVTDKPEEPITGDVADDLMDIYIDLKEGILLYEQDKTCDAVFQWQSSFKFHWGRHAVSALRALHCYDVEKK